MAFKAFLTLAFTLPSGVDMSRSKKLCSSVFDKLVQRFTTADHLVIQNTFSAQQPQYAVSTGRSMGMTSHIIHIITQVLGVEWHRDTHIVAISFNCWSKIISNTSKICSLRRYMGLSFLVADKI